VRRPNSINRAGLAAVLSACAGALSLGACQSGPESADRAPQFRQPSNLRPSRVLMGNEPLEDRDRNGYVDTFRIVVYVFAEEGQYPLPMTVDATFQFRLVGEDGKSLGVWAFAPREASRALFATQPGPAYGFEISLNSQGSDQIRAQSAGLTCELTLEDGERVRSREPLQLRIGGRDPG
jgi:hypothetical protein